MGAEHVVGEFRLRGRGRPAPQAGGPRGRSRQSVCAWPWALLPVCLGISDFPFSSPAVSPEKSLLLHMEGTSQLTVCPPELDSFGSSSYGLPL